MARRPLHVTQAVILVGGKGTRLGDLTLNTPKPLMSIGHGRVFLDILIREVSRYGVRSIILLAGHLGDMIRERYHGTTVNGCDISVEIEPAPLGTGGALTMVKDKLRSHFFLLNGDSFFDFPLTTLQVLLSQHENARVAMALKSGVHENRYGNVALEGEVVTRFDEKGEQSGPLTISAGIYLCRRDILGMIKDGQEVSIEREIFPSLLKNGAIVGCPGGGYFIDIGLTESLDLARRELPLVLRRKAVFFDRDNTLNIDAGYTYQPSDLKWVRGAMKAVKRANDAGFLVIVVSNQSGIGRGYYTEGQMHEFHAEMQRQLAALGAHIDAFYWCPFHADATLEQYRVDNHPDRKPNAGMLERAIAEWSLDVPQSFLVGDKQDDLTAASKAGLAGYLFDPKDDLDDLVAQLLLG